MFKTRRRLAYMSLVLLTPMAHGVGPLDPSPVRGLSITEIKAKSPQPAGRPILIQLVLTNTSKEPAFLWAGPTTYQSMNGVTVRITNARGKVIEAALENSYNQGGSGGFHKLQPRESEEAPAVVPPLPAGTYALQIGDKQAKVTINDDPQLAKERAVKLAENLVQSDDTFSPFVFGKYPDQAVTDALLDDLLTDDPQIVARAAHSLEHLRKVPMDAGTNVRKSMENQLKILSQQQNRRTDSTNGLAYLAGKIGTDEALTAVLDLVHSALWDDGALHALGEFKQEQAVLELRHFLKDRNESIRFNAARALAKRQDPAALPVLIEVARNTQSQWNQYAFPELERYPNHPEAKTALKEAGRSISRPSFWSWTGGFGGPGQLIRDPGVAEEVKLTKDQIEKITAMANKARKDLLGSRAQGLEPGTTVYQEQAEELFKENQKALARVLTPEQEKRLWQLNLQAQRTRALLLPEVERKIRLSVAQEEKIKAIMKDSNEQIGDIQAGPQAYPEETRKKIDAVNKESAEKIMAVLTETQKAAFREMIGPPFDFKAHWQKTVKDNAEKK